MTVYQNSQSMFEAIRTCFKRGQNVNFVGCYRQPEDPLVSNKERIAMTVHEIWKVTYLANRVKDHLRLQRGHKTRLWCSQDERRKKKKRPKIGETVVHRDAVGMIRYECNSKLIVSCATQDSTGTPLRTVRVHLRHHKNHRSYYDVTLPPDAAALVRENLEWSTPVSITPKVQALYPQVTAKQVHRAFGFVTPQRVSR